MLILFLVVFIDLVGFGIVIPILPYYAKQFGASATELGWLMASYSAMQFIFAPVWGRFSDHYGRRPILLISMLGTIFSMLALGFSSSLAFIFAARIFAGISGANISTATAYIADITTVENRAKGMGLIGAAFGLGFIFGPAIGGVLSKWGYATPMFFAAGLSALNWVYAYFRLKEPASTEESRARNRVKRFDRLALKQVFGNQTTRLATFTFFLVTIAMTQMEVVFALFMKEQHGFGAEQAGWLLALLGFIMALIQGGLIGRLSKFFGERRLILQGTLFMSVAMVLIAQSYPYLQLLTALALLAVGSAITSPSLSSLASQGAAVASRGATMGIYQSAGSLARIIGPIAAGFFYDHYGKSAPFLTASGIMILAFMAASFFESHLESKRKIFIKLKEAKAILKQKGFKGLIQTYGYKVVAIIFAYYLIRDLTLYLLVPFLLAKGILKL